MYLKTNNPLLLETWAINVWTMKCVGYDEAFQRELCTKYALWVSGVKREDDVKVEGDVKLEDKA